MINIVGLVTVVVLSHCCEGDETYQEEFGIFLFGRLKDAISGISVAVDRMMQAEPTDVAPLVPCIAYRSRMLGLM
jgi:hypothetical protein